MKEEISIGQLIADETENRLNMMEKEDYPFPERFSKADYTWVVIGVGVNLLLVILAMSGVIQ